jgi:tetratricopeptide (TPR) repeat protein
MILRFLLAFYSGLKSLSSGYYFNWGMNYARWGQPAKAMYYLNRAARLNTKGSRIYLQRGLLLIAMGQLESAVIDFNTAIDANPHYMEAYVNRSIVHTLSGRHEDAQNDIDQAVALGTDRVSLENRIAELRDQTE